jgi:hypothetical protein
VSDNVVVRSKPRVSADSIIYTPWLGLGTVLEVLSGPAAGSGYWWYRVKILGMELHGGITGGWLAAGDHDGEPWIASEIDHGTEAVPEPTLPVAITDVTAPEYAGGWASVTVETVPGARCGGGVEYDADAYAEDAVDLDQRTTGDDGRATWWWQVEVAFPSAEAYVHVWCETADDSGFADVVIPIVTVAATPSMTPMATPTPTPSRAPSVTPTP